MKYPDIFEGLEIPNNYLVKIVENEKRDLELELIKRKSIEAKKVKKETKTEICK